VLDMAVTYASLSAHKDHIRGDARTGGFHDFQEGLFPRTFARRLSIRLRSRPRGLVVLLCRLELNSGDNYTRPRRLANGRISIYLGGIIPSDGYSSMGERLLTAELPCVPASSHI
jgi:hypothetical protein